MIAYMYKFERLKFTKSDIRLSMSDHVSTVYPGYVSTQRQN